MKNCIVYCYVTDKKRVYLKSIKRTGDRPFVWSPKKEQARKFDKTTAEFLVTRCAGGFTRVRTK